MRLGKLIQNQQTHVMAANFRPREFRQPGQDIENPGFHGLSTTKRAEDQTFFDLRPYVS
jgi:hypothetical protein